MRVRHLASGLGRVALAAVAGAALMTLLGRALAEVTASCSMLCRPDVAIPLGALSGIVGAALSFQGEGRGERT